MWYTAVGQKISSRAKNQKSVSEASRRWASKVNRAWPVNFSSPDCPPLGISFSCPINQSEACSLAKLLRKNRQQEHTIKLNSKLQAEFKTNTSEAITIQRF